jgi:hypothetical protein
MAVQAVTVQLLALVPRVEELQFPVAVLLLLRPHH